MNHMPYALPATTPYADVEELVEPYTHVCLPGEPVLRLGPRAVIAVGTGLHTAAAAVVSSHFASPAPADCGREETLLAEYCAPLQRRPHPYHPHLPRYELESPAHTRYRPQAADPLVAIITRRVGQQYFHCYIGASEMAYLDATAFDGATKTSRPRLVEGDVVYCYVAHHAAAAGAAGESLPCASVSAAVPLSSRAGAGLSAAGQSETQAAGDEVTLSCTAAAVGLVAKDWTSGDAVFGPLEGGRVIEVSLLYARSLLTPPPPPRSSITCASRKPASPLAAHELSHGEGRTHSAQENPQQSARDANAAVDGGNRVCEKEDAEPELAAASGPYDDATVPASYLLELLGQHVPFEVCVGMNGMVWVRGRPSANDPTAETRRTVAVSSCILEGQNDATRLEMEARVASYFASV